LAEISSHLAQLRSLPSLHTLVLPATCAEREVDAEAVYGLTTLIKLVLGEVRHEHGVPVDDGGEWVLDLSRLTTLLSRPCVVYHSDGRASAGCEARPAGPHTS